MSKKTIKLTEGQYNKVHKYCSNNRIDLSFPGRAGCFHCLRIFDARKVHSWCDYQRDFKRNLTALCPYCHIDSVLPAFNLPFSLSKSLLRAVGKWAWKSCETDDNKIFFSKHIEKNIHHKRETLNEYK
jgi:hypothetical protein